MWIRLMFPVLAAALLLQVEVTHANERLPKWTQEKSVPQKLGERLYRKWLRIHTAAARLGKPVRADLTIDPKSGTISLDRGTDAPLPTERIKLPSGMSWRAFHISVHGVRELSFPVVLQRPHHHEKRSLQDDEEVWILGEARKTQLHFYVGSRTTGVTCGGSGRSWGVSKTRPLKVAMPAVRDYSFRSKVSMLPAEALHGRPTEFIESRERRIFKSKRIRIIEVVREPAK